MLTSLMISWRQGVDIAVGEGIIIQYPTLASSWGIRKVLCTWEISNNFRYDLDLLLFIWRKKIYILKKNSEHLKKVNCHLTESILLKPVSNTRFPIIAQLPFLGLFVVSKLILFSFPSNSRSFEIFDRKLGFNKKPVHTTIFGLKMMMESGLEFFILF